MLLLAVGTASLTTVALAEVADQCADLRNRTVYPDRQNGVPTRDPDPAEGVGQGHAVFWTGRRVQIREPRKAGATANRPEACQGRVRCVGCGRRRSRANARQQLTKRRVIPQQEVQQCNPFRIDAMHVRQRIHFLAQQAQRQARILDRIVPGVGDELVALDEPVVRVGWERERREFERVENRQIQAIQSRVLTPKLRCVVPTQVVPNEQLRACRCRVDAADHLCRFEPPSRQAHNGIGVRADRADLEDAVAVRGIGLDVDRKRRPADNDLSGSGGQLFVELGGHIGRIDTGWQQRRDQCCWR